MNKEICGVCNNTGWDSSLYRVPIPCAFCEYGKAVNTYPTPNSNNLAAYQELSRKTYRHLEVNSNLTYPVLGMVNEAGEFAGKFKKVFRDKGGVIDDTTREALRDELGDVLWYLTQICTNLGYTLDDLAQANLEKVLGRLERGTIHGDGDKR